MWGAVRAETAARVRRACLPSHRTTPQRRGLRILLLSATRREFPVELTRHGAQPAGVESG
eukprot:98756-Chlamydomonas_euryale.AAC.1